MFSKRCFSGRTGAIAAGLILLVSFYCAAQSVEDSHLPGWVLYEKGLSLYERGELGLALEYLNLSAKEGVLTPEALYRIGRIYEEEGDYLLAEMRYNEALKDARFLYVPEDKWLIQYSLAGIYLNRKENDRYEQQLLSIFDEEMKRNEEIIRREHSYVQMLKESGMDKLLLLFRIRLEFSQEAAAQLGVYYARSGEWKSSIIKNLYTVLTYFSGGLDFIMEKDPEFSFPVDLEEILESDQEFLISLYEGYAEEVEGGFLFRRNLDTLAPLAVNEDIQKAGKIILSRNPFFHMSPSLYALRKMECESGLDAFLESGKLYRALFYLALSLYNEGFPERAEEIWTLVSLSGRDTSWRTLSKKALGDPEIQTSFLIY